MLKLTDEHKLSDHKIGAQASLPARAVRGFARTERDTP
jgi:hypothetical protein